MMKSRPLQALWWDWLSTAERLQRSLAEQCAALTLRDLSRVERIQPDLESLMQRMKTIDEQAAAATRSLAEDLGVEPMLRSIVAALPQAEAQQVQAIAQRVCIAGDNISASLGRNRTLIENELTYVNGSLALIAKVASEQDGQFATSKAETVLMDQVA